MLPYKHIHAHTLECFVKLGPRHNMVRAKYQFFCQIYEEYTQLPLTVSCVTENCYSIGNDTAAVVQFSCTTFNYRSIKPRAFSLDFEHFGVSHLFHLKYWNWSNKK